MLTASASFLILNERLEPPLHLPAFSMELHYRTSTSHGSPLLCGQCQTCATFTFSLYLPEILFGTSDEASLIMVVLFSPFVECVVVQYFSVFAFECFFFFGYKSTRAITLTLILLPAELTKMAGSMSGSVFKARAASGHLLDAL